MCIAIIKPKYKSISKDLLHRCWKNNPNGAGFMFSENEKLVVKKGYMKWETFWNDYNIEQNKKGLKFDMVIHFRISTSGGITPENTHPFMVNKNLAMVHNGIISNCEVLNSNKPDTQNFIENILQKLPDNFLRNDVLVELISGYINASKLVFMDNNGKIDIINEQLGKWENGIWYSNDTYKFSYKSYVYGNKFDDCWEENYRFIPSKKYIPAVRNLSNEIIVTPPSSNNLPLDKQTKGWTGSYITTKGETIHFINGRKVVLCKECETVLLPEEENDKVCSVCRFDKKNEIKFV